MRELLPGKGKLNVLLDEHLLQIAARWAGRGNKSALGFPGVFVSSEEPGTGGGGPVAYAHAVKPSRKRDCRLLAEEQCEQAGGCTSDLVPSDERAAGWLG